MKYVCTTLAICLIALAPSPSAHATVESGATESLTPQQAVDLALARHPELMMARLDVDAADGLRRQAAQLPNPTAAYGIESLDQAGADAGEWAVEAQLPLGELWRRGPRIGTARAAVALAEAAVSRTAADLRLGVLVTYTEAFAAAAQGEALRATAMTLNDVVRMGRLRLDAGDLSEYEVRRMELEAMRAARAGQRASLREAEARRRLALYLGTGSDAMATRLHADFPSPLPQDELATLIAQALAGGPEVMRATLAYAAAQAEVARVRRSRWPGLEAGLGYKDEEAGASGWTGTVSVDVPLFDRAQGQLQAARASERRAQQALEWARTQATGEVTDLHARLLALHDQLQQLPSTDRLTTLLTVAQQTYDEGDSDLITLIDAAASLIDEADLRGMLLQEYQITYYKLERAIGTPLTEAARRTETQ